MSAAATGESGLEVRALVIDNDSFTLDLAEILLNDAGVVDVMLAQTGAEALRMVDDPHRAPSIIFCDLAMEVMDGVEVIRHLAQRAYSGHLVLLSGSNSPLLNAVARMARASDLNVIGTLSKPLSREKFATIISRSRSAGAVGTPPVHVNLTLAMVREGLERRAVEAFVQPKVSATTKVVKGGEVLLRWRHTDGSLLSPLAVVPVIEDDPLIDALTKQIFERAAEAMGEWRAAGWTTTLSVNVSARNLLDLSFPEWLVSEAHRCGIDPHAIMLEITESQLVGDLGSSLDVVARMYLMGFRLSIDDFGTGYSNFDQLKQVPLREIKIDRSLLLGAAHDESGRALLRAAVELGRALNVLVTVEGVETFGEWDMVQNMGCDVIQGYVVSRPMPIAEFPTWLTQWNELHGIGGPHHASAAPS